MKPLRFVAPAAAALIGAVLASPSLADVISDWNTAKIPPPPELKEVTVDPSTTALLLLDIMKAGCSARPRCVAAMPNIKRLHDQARQHNMLVWYSLVGSNGKATADDVMDAAIKPVASTKKPLDPEAKLLDSAAEPLDSGTKLIDSGANQVDSWSQQLDSKAKQVASATKFSDFEVAPPDFLPKC